MRGQMARAQSLVMNAVRRSSTSARERLQQALEAEGSSATLHDFMPGKASRSSAYSAQMQADLDVKVDGQGTDDSPYSITAPKKEGRTRKPDWLKRSVPGGENYMRIKYASHFVAN